MRTGGGRGAAVDRRMAVAACGVLLMSVPGCGGSAGESRGAKGPDPTRDGRTVRGAPGNGAGRTPVPTPGPSRIPGVGDGLNRRIPGGSRQVVVVYGDDEDSPESTVVLYMKEGSAWKESGRWRGHNGKAGWTTDHHLGDLRSPVGVFTLSDAGGLLDDPGTRLPYSQGESYQAPEDLGESHRDVFDYVIAIDYNRLRGTPPHDPARPEGEEKGGGIWLHVDHEDGTLACVTLPESGMRHLLRVLDPDQEPVVVMGDRAHLETWEQPAVLPDAQ
ncbi:hypothetical protein ACFYZE_08750 [Streptomyces sp. NPDC001796]|uniref:hypothetical protein n=1 Tax=Streptomyces sp. NPDC001796 TaxID=3364609 RepID=UPI003685DCBF